MIKNISISTFINSIFTLALISTLITFSLFIELDKQRHQVVQKNRYEIIADNFLSAFEKNPSKEELRRLYNKFKVKLIKNMVVKLDILSKGKDILFKKTYLGTYRIYLYKSEYYLYVQRFGYNIMLKDFNSNKYNMTIIIIVLVFCVFIILFLYIILKKKLLPLKYLNHEITKFSKGNLNIKFTLISDDEIGTIGKSFNTAITLIKNQTESKNLFMRNMMHELKTPITKAMFIAETLNNKKDKDNLQKAFKRMDNIIKELATVERITSKTSIIYKEKTSFFKVYQKALEITMANTVNISSKIFNFEFEVDDNLFSVALKNLIDNGIKFSLDKKVLIFVNSKKIEIISKGNKLKYKLDYYTEPFSQEEKRVDGFGLGLYIVKTIVHMHGFTLKYYHKNDKNYFAIILQ